VSEEPIFNRLALIGFGLIGGSIARAARAQKIVRSIVATARSPQTRKRIAELGLVDQVVETNAAAVEGADLVIVCIPVGACGAVAKEIGPHLMQGATLSDVGSVKGSVLRDMSPHLPPHVHFIPAHPVAGTENSGPEAALLDLFYFDLLARGIWFAKRGMMALSIALDDTDADKLLAAVEDFAETRAPLFQGASR